jgi:hypothetical protein
MPAFLAGNHERRQFIKYQSKKILLREYQFENQNALSSIRINR